MTVLVNNCPFCNHPRCKLTMKAWKSQVWCPKCGARGPFVKMDMGPWTGAPDEMKDRIKVSDEGAIEAWNKVTRKTP